MIKALYKRILKKLNLSKDQLMVLKERLASRNICKGPFLRDGKMCPNTTALAIREGREKFQKADEVMELLKRYHIGRTELWIFYALFDIPAMVSERFFKKALKDMRNAVDDLIREKSGG